MNVRIQYQHWSESSQRPYDYAMNNREIVVDSIAGVPSVGDHVAFLTEADGELGTYRVRSRLFTHWINTEGNWMIFANVVLEPITDSAELLKE